jgi:curved DNA-binding protein CbpA
MDFYEILQVDRRADAEVIQAAYRALARRHHPAVGGDPRRMSAINEAWAALGNAAARKHYDASLRRASAVAAVAGDPRRDARPARETVGVMGNDPVASSRSEPAATRPPETRPAETRPAEPVKPTIPGAGRVLDFGRYEGWSVADVSRQDPDYLLWLERTPVGRSMRSDIQRAMEMRRGANGAATATVVPSRQRGRWFR